MVVFAAAKRDAWPEPYDIKDFAGPKPRPERNIHPLLLILQNMYPFLVINDNQ